MFYDWQQEDYEKACRAVFRRCERRGWIYSQPNRYDSEMTKEGIIILRTGDRELGRYNTNNGRLIP